MANRSFILPALLIASIGVVTGTYLMVGAKRAPEVKSDEVPGAAMLARGNLGPAEYDSARRGDDVLDDEPAPVAPIALPAAAPIEEPVNDRNRPDPPPEPAPPVVLDEEAQAAQDAFFALRTKVAEDARSQLEKQSSALRSACWKPGLTGGASSASFSVNASFDAGGQLLGMGISDSREGGSAPAVSQCLRQQTIKLKVPPPGQALTVDVQLRLP